MWQAIAAIVQLIILIFKNNFEKDAELKKKKEALHAETKEAIKSGDIDRIAGMFFKLREK